MKSRVFEIVQYEVNPQSGESLGFDEDVIMEGLEHKSIKQYAYIRHDKDVDEGGKLIAPHWHVVCKSERAIDFDSVAKWFNVPVQQVQAKKGKNNFLDAVEYLTHENLKQQEAGKHLYQDEEVKANVDFRGMLTERALRKAKYGKDNLTDSECMRLDVLKGGKTLRQCQSENPLLYARERDRLRKLRLDYLELNATMPQTRINYYICGNGGDGKGLTSRALARALYPDIKDDDELFFCVGSGKTLFDGYDGQPVVIWNDYRAIELLDALGDRGNVFKVFDSHPQSETQNIKYGHIRMINAVNIVNSVQPYPQFLDGLAREYTDRNGCKVKTEYTYRQQAWRRFPFVFELGREEDTSGKELYTMRFGVNAGYMHTGAMTEYEMDDCVRTNLVPLITMLKNERDERFLDASANTLHHAVCEFHAAISKGTSSFDEEDDVTLKELLQSTGSKIIWGSLEEEQDDGEPELPEPQVSAETSDVNKENTEDAWMEWGKLN